jgi:hypothetical protein
VRDTYDRIVTALLLARGPTTLAELAAAADCDAALAQETVDELRADGLVVVDDDAICWRAYTLTTREEIAASSYDLRPHDEPVAILQEYLATEYTPPPHARYLAVYQCSARRPFSSSPSHGSINHAIVAATGYHPKRHAAKCPVHVVVLAAKGGPIPYDLEGVFPACIRAEGLGQFSPEEYEEARATLAQYVARYLKAHAGHYDGIATFTSGRWADVMEAARSMSDLDFPVLPRSDGPSLTRVGDTVPHTYWQKRWIQLALAIMGMMPEDERHAAEARLRDMGAEWTG